MIQSHSFRRVLKLGFVSFWRHWWLSVTSILFMAVTLIIISLFIVLNFTIQASTTAMKNKIDMNILFKPNASEEQIKSLQQELSSRDDVRSVEYINKQSALERWGKLKIKDSVKNLVTENNNPLPEALAVKVLNTENLDGIDTFVSSGKYAEAVETTSYKKNKETIQTFLNITKVVRKVGVTVSVIFFVIAIMIVLNTIRMAIFTRKDEIEIMRLVGESNHFITIPFVVEGVLYGVLGCVLSLIFMSFGAIWLSNLLTTHLDLSLNIKETVMGNLGAIAALQLLFGILIGVCSAMISINRHLRA